MISNASWLTGGALCGAFDGVFDCAMDLGTTSFSGDLDLSFGGAFEIGTTFCAYSIDDAFPALFGNTTSKMLRHDGDNARDIATAEGWLLHSGRALVLSRGSAADSGFLLLGDVVGYSGVGWICAGTVREDDAEDVGAAKHRGIERI